MSYSRIYPIRSNTLFKKFSGPIVQQNGNVNTGANTIFELQNGNGTSVIVLDFDISNLTGLLSQYNYTCNLKLWDAGTIFEPAMPPQTIDLIYFEQEFAEGNGFDFLGENVLQEPSNYNLRDTTNNWNGVLYPAAATGSFIIDTSGFSVGDIFEINGTNFAEGVEFFLGATDEATATNLTIAINNHPTIGLLVATTHNLIGNGSGTITIIANATGTLGNNITTSVVSGLHIASNATLLGGLDIQGVTAILQLDKANEDLSMDVTSFIDVALANTTSPKFGLRTTTHTPDVATYTKFLYSRHTRTVFKPFLEFIIEDEIVDQRNKAVATQSNKFYLLNESGSNFVGAIVSAEIQSSDGTVLSTPTVVNLLSGIYCIQYAPTLAQVGTPLYDVWKIDGVIISKKIINVTSPNIVFTNDDKYKGLFFAPTTAYTHALIRKNDIVRFNVTSEIRGKGVVLEADYEYRIISTNGFEMIPWTKTSIYNNKIYFSADTSFFFSELEYEVFIRLKGQDFVRTSEFTYKFKLKEDQPTHLQDKNANPYNNRDYIFQK